MLFNIYPSSILTVILFLLLLSGCLTFTFSLVFFYIRRNTIGIPQRQLYRTNLKKALFYALIIILLLVFRLLYKYFVLKSL
jgi:hypothetical protein